MAAFGHSLGMAGKTTVYSKYVKQYVKVVTDNGQVFGRLEEINLERAVLRPSLVSVITEYSDRTWIEEIEPSTVSYISIKGMQHVHREALEHVCEEAKLIDKIKQAKLQELLSKLKAEDRQLELFPEK